MIKSIQEANEIVSGWENGLPTRENDLNEAKGYIQGWNDRIKSHEVQGLVDCLKIVRDGYLAEEDSNFDWDTWYRKTRKALIAFEKAGKE